MLRQRGKRLGMGVLLGLVAVVGLLTGGGGPAWAALLPESPQPVSGTSLLQGVACPTAGLCVAVGQDSSPTGVVVPLGVSGATVAPGAAQTVSGPRTLPGVACPTASLCLAVGQDSNSTAVVVPLTVSGATVTPGTVQSVSGTYELLSVACPTANLCLAVGRTGNDGVVVPLTVSGSTVAAGTAQTVSGTGTLWHVFCPASDLCVAAGQDSGNSGVVVPLGVSGGSVTPGTAQTMSAANPLYGIACPTATLCIGVGNGISTGVLVPVTVSGSTVTAGTVQTVSGTLTLPGVACPAADLCLTVGGRNPTAGLVVPLGVSGGAVTAGSVQTASGTDGLIGVACPAAGFCVAVGQSSSSLGVVVPLGDTTPPTVNVSLTSPNGGSPNGSNGWFKTSPVSGSVTATDPSTVTAITCTDNGNSLAVSTSNLNTTSASGTFSISTDATHLVVCQATDGASPANTGAATGSNNTVTVTLDVTAPVVNCGSADGLWHATDVSIACTASDVTSGLAVPADTSFNLTTNVPAGTETSNASTNSLSVCDAAGNCRTAGPITGNKVDKKPPSITITTPVNNQVYTLNQAVAANYSCTDGGSGVATCAGPVANGANINTSSPGTKSFTVNTTDKVGNAATPQTVSYSVDYATSGTCDGAQGHAILQPINPDGSSVFKQGSTVPAKFRVCDGAGNSVGTPGVVTSFKLIGTTSGNVGDVDETVDSTTPDMAFRWDATDQQWIFNIGTKSLAAGSTYTYLITLNDGTTIQFSFALK